MNKGRRQKLKGGDEVDVIYSRHLYCYLINRPKNVKLVKRKMNKRYRKEVKEFICKEISSIGND